MTIEQITKVVGKLQKKYVETDPFRLAQAMKICIGYMPMGFNDGCCKGFYITHRRVRHITINSDMEIEFQKIVLAHEMGHAVLHPDGGTAAFHEFKIFDDTDMKEYEANIFAAELLLTDEAVLSVLNDDLFFFQAAKALYVPAELLDFKFRIMKRRGYKLDAPIVSNGDFLKSLDTETLNNY